MSENKPETGTISWTDLTINNADEVSNFYSKVVGWKVEEVPMGNYCDYSMLTLQTDTPVAGICHSIGVNANMPPQWLIYINVANISNSILECTKLGGKVIVEPKNYANMGTYCVIQDPAGAVCALFEAK